MKYSMWPLAVSLLMLAGCLHHMHHPGGHHGPGGHHHSMHRPGGPGGPGGRGGPLADLRQPAMAPPTKIPPAAQLHRPGPGVDGPGPGVIPPLAPAMSGPPPSSQVLFRSPDGMQVQFSQSTPGSFDSDPLFVPARYNFGQGNLYRLKLTNIPGRPGLELFPTLEIAPATPGAAEFLDHSAIPVELTEEDFDQVVTGNFVTKVLYLPDPENQALAVAGVETLVSTRLDPGLDPVVEADRRGSILAIVRVGNKDPNAGGGDAAGGVVGTPGVPGNPAMGLPGMAPGTQWGMPITGTPIGLNGPPHLPLGGPAGLQRHVIRNHTPYDLPEPTRRLDIQVREQPGYSYPPPVDHIKINEGPVPPMGHPYPNQEAFDAAGVYPPGAGPH